MIPGQRIECSGPMIKGGNNMKKFLAVLLVSVIAITMVFAQSSTESAASSGDQLNGYPEKEIKLIIPAKAGTELDNLGRAILDRIDLGVKLYIENVAGANQTVGITQGAAAPADGYTITVLGAGGNWTQPHLIDLPYSPDSFRCIANIRDSQGLVFVVNKSSKYQTMPALLDALKAGERFKYATSNTGSVAHIMSLYFMENIGAKNAVHVSYNGGSEALNGLISGEIDFGIFGVAAAKTLIDSGDLTVLALTFPDKAAQAALPEGVKTMADYGVPGLEDFGGYPVLAVPAGTPDAVYNWLCEKFGAFLASDAWKEYLAANGLSRNTAIVGEEMDKKNHEIYEKFGHVIKDLMK